MSKGYLVNEFATLAGVTVKALQHYDRLGLLKPARTAAGHRRYAARDLERLEQIVALKLIGLSLKEIKDVLDCDTRPVPDVLRAQRRVLEDKRARLDRAIAAIQEVENDPFAGGQSSIALLRHLIGVIGMQDDIDVMKQYFSDEAWPRAKRHYQSPPSPEWIALLHETEAIIDDDPASERAQALAVRWRDLWRVEMGGDPAMREGMMKAWVDRERWPESLRRRMTELNLERVLRFLGEAGWEMAARQWEKSGARLTVPHRASESRIALFRDVEAALASDPRGSQGQMLARRWEALTDAETGGDTETKNLMMRAMTSYPHWPWRMREYVAGLYGTTPGRWEQVVNFIVEATGSRARTRVDTG